MRQLLVAGFVVSLAIQLRADSQLIPLVGPDDPVRITNARFEFEDGVRPVMIVELENETTTPISTRDVYLSTVRFYTKGENAGVRNPKIWDCGQASWASKDEPPQTILPGARVVVRVSLGTSCEHNREHEHFSIEVSQIGDRVQTPAWRRPRGEAAELLIAAMPHP